jgi:hypothetical protein
MGMQGSWSCCERPQLGRVGQPQAKHFCLLHLTNEAEEGDDACGRSPGAGYVRFLSDSNDTMTTPTRAMA